MEKKLDGNYTRMLWAISKMSWRQHSTKQQLYGHRPLTTKTTKVRQTRNAGHCWESRDEFISDVLQWTSTHGQLCADTGCTLKTCRKQWTIGRCSKRGSGIFVQIMMMSIRLDTTVWENWATGNGTRSLNLTIWTNVTCTSLTLSWRMRRTKFAWILRYKRINSSRSNDQT